MFAGSGVRSVKSVSLFVVEKVISPRQLWSITKCWFHQVVDKCSGLNSTAVTHLMPLNLRMGLMSSGRDMGSGHKKFSVTGTMFFFPAKAVAISCKSHDHFINYFKTCGIMFFLFLILKIKRLLFVYSVLCCLCQIMAIYHI